MGKAFEPPLYADLVAITGPCAVYSNRNLIRDTVDYSARCQVCATRVHLEFDPVAIEDCINPALFVGGSLRSALDGAGCRCSVARKEAAIASVNKALGEGKLLVGHDPGYPTSAAAMNQIVGTGDWSQGYIASEDSGDLVKVFTCSTSQAVKAVSFYESETDVDAPDMTLSSFHMTMGDQHCGRADCTRCDPMERMVDGVTVRDCLDVFQRNQRETNTNHQRFVPVYLGGTQLTTAQMDAARAAWSASLRAKAVEAKEKERRRIVCDDDRWEA